MPTRRQDGQDLEAGALKQAWPEKDIIMRSASFAMLLLPMLGLSACGDLNQTQQRTATGALGGGAIGGILGSFGGNAGLGALLGAGAGGAGGYLYDQSQQSDRGYSRDGYDRGGYDRGGRNYRRY
jgi:hypothetical protein